MTSRGLYTDEHAEFERPRRRTRPRTKDHPDYSAAAIGVVITVDRGRYRLVVEDREVVATKARQLGRTWVIVGDEVRVVGDDGAVLGEREVGLYDNIDRDIALYFAEWGFDLIKVDACGARGLTPESPWVSSGKFRALGPFIDSEAINRTDIPAVHGLYDRIRLAIEKYNPDNDFVYSLCVWGSADVRSWGKNVGNMSRTSDDIAPTWGRMLHSFDSAARRSLCTLASCCAASNPLR